MLAPLLLASWICAAPEPAAEAQGQAPTDNFELEWSVPAGCPPAAALREETARLLGRDPGEGVDLVRAQVAISRGEEGFTLALAVSTPAGQTRKQLSAQRCETLVDAAALVLAVSVDPLAALAAPPRTGEPEASASSPSTPHALSPSASDPMPPARPRTRAFVGVAAGLSGLVLPGVGPGASVSLGLRPAAPLRSELFATAWLPQRERFSAGGASMWMWTAGLRLCAQPRLGAIELPVCLAGEGGQVRAVGLDLRRSEATAQPWAALLLGPGLEWPFHRRLRLVAAVDLVAVLVRPGFAVEGLGLVYRAPKVGLRALLGLEFTISGAAPRR